MKRIWIIYKKYFLIYHLFFFIAIILSLFQITEEDGIYESINIICLLFSIITSIGIYDYWKQEIYRTNKIKRELNSNYFSVFRRKGFREMNNELKGKIENYYVNVGIEWESYQKKPNYYFRVLYDPMSLGRNLEFAEYLEFNDIEDNNFFVSLNMLDKSHSHREFLKYKLNDSITEITKMIDYLKTKNLKPINFKQWEKSLAEVSYTENSYLSKI